MQVSSSNKMKQWHTYTHPSALPHTPCINQWFTCAEEKNTFACSGTEHAVGALPT